MLTFFIYIFFLISILSFICINKQNPVFGSDHFFHKTIINTIKNNGNKYFKSIDAWLFGNFRGYPILYHYFLSFFQFEKVEKFHQKHSYIFFNIITLCLALFLYVLLDKWQMISDKVFFFIATFLSSTILFDPTNARLTGVSGRSVGLILGHVIVMLLICIYLFEELRFVLIPITILFSILTYLTSQFTTQFIVFLYIINSFFQLSFIPLFILITSSFLYFFLFKEEAKYFMKFQIKHKKGFLFYNPFKDNRTRTWKYLFRQFWMEWYRNKESFFKFIVFHQNPLIKLLIGLPSFILMVYVVFNIEFFGMNKNILSIIYSVLVIFIITTLGKFKILGEAERYIDFIVPAFVSLLTINLHFIPSFLIYIVIFISMLIMFLKIYFKKHNEEKKDDLMNIRLFLINQREVEYNTIRLGSNCFEYSKRLSDVNYKVFYGFMFDLYKYNPYMFFKKKWPYLEDEYLYYFIIKFKLNMVLLEESQLDEKPMHHNIEFKLLKPFGKLSLYKVTAIHEN